MPTYRNPYAQQNMSRESDASTPRTPTPSEELTQQSSAPQPAPTAPAAPEPPPNAVAQDRQGNYLDSSGNIITQSTPPAPRRPGGGGGGARKSAAKKKKAAKEAKKEKEEKPNIEFDDQSFFWDHMKMFENETQRAASAAGKKTLAIPAPTNLLKRERQNAALKAYHNALKPFEYSNFLQIKDDQPLTTKNKLFANGINSLNKVSNVQLSSIVPSFKLFKVLPQQPTAGGKKNRKRIEFPFNKFTTMDSILESRENRGTDVGMRSVKWEDLGANPANTGLAFKGSMTLHFQSFEGIFKTRVVDAEDIRFADLLVQQSLTGRSGQKNPTTTKEDRANSSNVNCNTQTEIHMECGWTLPPEGMYGDPKLAEELEKMKRTYIITPIDQSIKVTNNGAVDMDITFCAAIEGRTFGASCDLLNIDETNLPPGFHKTSIASLKAAIKETRERIREQPKGVKKTAATKSTVTKAAGKKAKEKAIEERKQLKEKYTAAKSNLRSERYKRLLSILRSGVKNRIFYIDLEPEMMDHYKTLLQIGADAYSDRKSATKEEREENRKDLAEARRSFAALAKDFMLGVAKPSTANALASSPPENEDAKDKKTLAKSLVDGRYRAHYIFLGDIVEAAMKILYDAPNPDGKSMGPSDFVCPQIRTDVRVLLGCFSYLDPASGEIRSMGLADVPVSFSYFNSWWYDNVVKRKANVYPLRVFLSDLCGKLLNNVMSPKRFGGMPGKRIRCRVQSVFTKKSHPLDNEWEKKTTGPKSRIDIPTIFREIGKGKANQYSQWLYIYVAGGATENSGLRGKIDEDLKRNIPHYFVGADSGVIKDINFSKTKIPSKRESMLLRSKNEGTIQDSLLFADRYDAKVTLLGNPIFKPGMLIYIDPRAMGLGIADIAPEQYMSDLGIGGYYRVVRVHSKLDSSKFETEISTVSEFSSREIAKSKEEALWAAGGSFTV